MFLVLAGLVALLLGCFWFCVGCLFWFVFLFPIKKLCFVFFNDDLGTPPTWRPHSEKNLHGLGRTVSGENPLSGELVHIQRYPGRSSWITAQSNSLLAFPNYGNRR